MVTRSTRASFGVAALAACALGAPGAAAQTAQQQVKPPVAYAWIDLATFSGMGMPGMAAGASPMQMLGGMLGGGRQSANTFGMTQAASAGRWVDVTLHTRNNPSLREATQSVPQASRLAPTLKLVAPAAQKAPPPEPGDERVDEIEPERPKGRILLYWGCSESVRPGQPAVLDMASASAGDIQRFFVSRRATQRGTHAAPGRPVWPNPDDSRMVPADASMAGEHAFAGQGVPEGFRFALPATSDLMPPLEIAQREAGGAVVLEWKPLPTARGYFLAAMSGRGENEMVLWSSSELPDTGMGLIDYQTNASVDRWVREKVLLAPGATRCPVPKAIFGEEVAMLRAIAYGNEFNVAHPPRPSDPKVPWEPQWAAKVRVKSVASAMLGREMPAAAPAGGSAAREAATDASRPAEGTAPAEPQQRPANPLDLIKPADVLRGIFGR